MMLEKAKTKSQNEFKSDLTEIRSIRNKWTKKFSIQCWNALQSTKQCY